MLYNQDCQPCLPSGRKITVLMQTNTTDMTTKHPTLSLSDLTLTALMTAVLCILCPLALPVGPVPVTLGVFAVFLASSVLGPVKSALACLLYLLLGIIGLPVFSGYTGGIGKLLGPTGGYIIGYLFLALICGFFIEKFPEKLPLQMIGFLFGTLVLYLFGTVWLKKQTGLDFRSALFTGVIPYIPGDFAKLFIAAAIAQPLKKRLKKAGLL